MPSFRGVTCTVRANSANLKEWDVRTIGTGSRRKKISCYIQSEGQQKFSIRLKPDIPYGEEHWSDLVDVAGSSQQHRRGAFDGHALSDPRPESAPPFHFLASVYLDGRSKPERRSIVYLDPDHEEFDYDGVVKMDSRWMEGHDGRLHEYTWIFGDVGVDMLFNNLSILASDQNEDGDLASALGGAQLEGNDKEATPRIGSIVVKLQRITIGRRWKETHYRARHTEGDQEGVDTSQADRVSHTAKFENERVVKRSVPCIGFEPYITGEETFAEFHFHYRNNAALRRFGFPGFPQPPPQKTPQQAVHTPRRKAKRGIESSIAKLGRLGGSDSSSPSDREAYRTQRKQSVALTHDGQDENEGEDYFEDLGALTLPESSLPTVGKHSFEVPLRPRCADSATSLDSNTYLSPPAAKQFQDMTSAVEGDDNVSEASTLPDFKMGTLTAVPPHSPDLSPRTLGPLDTMRKRSRSQSRERDLDKENERAIEITPAQKTKRRHSSKTDAMSLPKLRRVTSDPALMTRPKVMVTGPSSDAFA